MGFNWLTPVVDRLSLSIKNIPNTLNVEYHDIDKRLPEICEYLGCPYNEVKHKELQDQNITVEITEYTRKKIYDFLAS